MTDPDSAVSPATRPRVIVVDADRRVRDSLSELLALGDEVTVVGRAGDRVEAMALCSDVAPDAIVVDPRLPDVEGGVDLLAEIRSRFPATAVLVLSWPGTGGEEAARRVGADGFVAKSAAPAELVEKIVELTAGRVDAGVRPDG